MSRFLIAYAVAVGLGGAAATNAAVTVAATPTGALGSMTDLFDQSRGTTIVSSSAINPVGPALNAIGGVSATAEPVNTVFADGVTNTELLTFKTASAVTIGGFNILLAEDAPSNNSLRGFSSVALLGSNDGVTFSLLESANLGSGTYISTYGANGVTVAATFAPVTYQYFQFQGVNRLSTMQGFNGGRIVEIDAVAPAVAPVPEPASWAMMVMGFGAIGMAARRRAVIALPARG